MKYSDLVQKIRNHSIQISKSSSDSARYRAASYERAAALIETNTRPNAQVSKLALSKLPFTEYMLGKVMDAIEGRLEIAEIDKQHGLVEQLSNFPGIGQARTEKLIKAGIKNISQLKQKKYHDMLTNETILTLKFNPVERIPRQAIEAFEKALEPLKRKYHWEIVGSYRRQKSTSGDIDLMLIDDDQEIAKKFIADLTKLGYQLHIYAEGPDRYGTLINLSPVKHNIWVRADFFRASLEDAPAMLLYSTGSKEHNVLMRAKAKKLGLLLNQRGLFKGKVKMPIEDEKGFFDALGLEYKPPAKR
jgi:DNA polymerase/3'-5' exonuclease PolX